MNSTNSYLDKRNKLILENQSLIWKMLTSYNHIPTMDDFNTAVCVFMELYPKYNDKYKISTFIYRVVRPMVFRAIFRNKYTVTYSYGFLEKKINREKIQKELGLIEEADKDMNSQSYRIDENIETAIDVHIINNVIDRYLNSKERIILYKYYIENKTNLEIGKEIGLRTNQVWYMVGIIRTKIQYVIRMIEKIANTEDYNERKKLKQFLRRMLLFRNKNTNNLRGGLPYPKQAETQVGCKF